MNQKRLLPQPNNAAIKTFGLMALLFSCASTVNSFNLPSSLQNPSAYSRTESKCHRQTRLSASLRDLVNNDENPKNKKTQEANFFSKINSESSNRGQFPTRTKTTLTPEEEERGQHVDRLGTFSFASSSPSSGSSGGSSLADIVPEDGGAADAETKSEESEAKISTQDKEKSDISIDELAPDNFNNRGVFISKHKFPKDLPTARDISGGEEGSPKDDHDGALRTFSFASFSKDAAASTQKTASSEGVTQGIEAETRKMEGVTQMKGVAQKSIAVDQRTMDRLGTFSLARSNKPEYSNTASSTSAASAAAADSTGGTNKSTPDHLDRMTTFSFASSSPKSTSSPTKSPDDDSNTLNSDLTSTSSTSTLPKRTSLSALASSVTTTTRNDRINLIKSQNDPRTLHPDGMNVPRLNKGGFVQSMSTLGSRRNIFQRIDEQINYGGESGVDEDGSVAGAANDDGDAVTDWGDLAEAMGAQAATQDDTSNGSHDNSNDCFIGFDLGTSGARMSVLQKQETSQSYTEVFAAALSWDDILHYDDAYDWRSAVDALLMRAKEDVPQVMAKVKAICVSGTSATCVLLEKGGLDVSRMARMYNFDVASTQDSNKKGSSKSGKVSPAERVLDLIDKYVPAKHTARATTGSLAKLLLWNEEESLVDGEGNVKEMLCHQSDYISLSLMYGGIEKDKQCTVSSDWHNCLKLGYDVKNLSYPEWMLQLLKEGANIPSPNDVLPSKVVSPGEPIGQISPIVATKYGLPTDTVMVGGTTDSNAAFFAAAGSKPEFGTAVTSLGSTVALKQLSKTYVEDASKGVYSHRFPRFGSGDGEQEEAWLIGGASNVGCAVLRQEEFSNEELADLSADIDPFVDSPLVYYPLTKVGERFPVSDSEKSPVLDPKPDSRKEYLHGILQAIGDVERDGYRTLGELGATPDRPTEILTCGGGSKNDMWTKMRERRLGDICTNERQRIIVKRAMKTEASFGAALLAAASFE